ncbi:sensor histidine kinase [Christensenella hongkongensis]|uniref:sensor histidine kinase n=1 Tax=Christensenella hongkongensis TaxID=270498 RepID=UPI002670EA68|nr:HAMP domain-containing sensor histidine kinase [Christensenella hongkongensis]
MKSSKISVKWKIFSYILIFAAAMLVLLWLFQIVFLNDFYQAIKQGEIKKIAQMIEQNIDNSDVQSLIDRIGQRFDVCVRVVDAQEQEVYAAETLPDCVIHKLPEFELEAIKQKTIANGGSMIQIMPRTQFVNSQYNQDKFQGNVPPPDSGMSESLIYSHIITDADGTQLMLLLNSKITPVSSTVETLRVQLIYVTIILIACALFLAFMISKWVSKPIVRINKSAKKLARAEYDDVHFDDTGYREIAELADTLNYAARELSKVENLRRELIANISHDLRTPLTLITGYAEVMRDIPGESTPQNIQIIIDEAKRLTTLVNDVMDISKLQAGTQTLEKTRFNLTQAIRDILSRYTKLVEQDGYTLEFIHGDDVFVEADMVKITQVVYNLVNNAITYTGKDKKVVVRQVVRDGSVTISVEDDGEGIPADKLEYIWDRYYKVDKAHKRAAVGTGLGLSIVKGVLGLHNAQYGVTSEEGKGSVFWFRLPESNERAE